MQCTQTAQSVMSRDDNALISAKHIPESVRKRQTPQRESISRKGQSSNDVYPTPPSTNVKLQSPSLRDYDPFADYAAYASYADKGSPTKVVLAEEPTDVFESPDIKRQRRTSAAANQFHNAARRLALSTISPQIQNRSPTPKLQFRSSLNNEPQRSSFKTLGDFGIISPVNQRTNRVHNRHSINSQRPPPTFHDAHPDVVGGGRQHPLKAHADVHRISTRPRRMSRLAQATNNSDHINAVSDIALTQPLPLSPTNPNIENQTGPPSPTTRQDHSQQPTQTDDFQAAPRVVDSDPSEDKVRASFDSAVSEALGDRCLQLKGWEIWVQRIFFAFIVFGINIALGLAYLGSHKHPYLLAILVFIKSKDVLSTLVDIFQVFTKRLHDLIWPPKPPKAKMVLSLVCAYAETEEQIMKTVKSLAASTLTPHKQVICIILDGKPRDVLAHMTDVKVNIQRPYTTWRGKRGEIKVHAGFIEGTPLVFVEKVKNAGKKDSLILGHDLFNYPRDDMSNATKLLRKDIWTRVLPAILSDTEPKAIDYIFCTDADSTIHEHALQRLADALLRGQNTIAACGVLFAELDDSWGEYAPWHLFQQFQYTFGQYVRRQAEGAWGRVTCLPGCVTMIVVRPEMGDAISQYARPVTEHNLFRHQVQYLGTDRRLTWCMMSQNKHLRTLFVPEATSETVTPSSLSHYLSQRRRWASNAYFNDYFYALGPHQRLITRLFAVVDLVRLTLVYYRVFNTAYFIHGLVTKKFYIIKIIPTLVVTKTPAVWYLILVAIREPVLRKRLHKLLLGMCINQVISPFLSVLVFTNVLFHMGSQSWGKTGFSTQGTSAPAPADPNTASNTASAGGTSTMPQPVVSTPQEAWTPRSLAKTVKDAIQGSIRRPQRKRVSADLQTPARLQQSTPGATDTQPSSVSDAHNAPTIDTQATPNDHVTAVASGRDNAGGFTPHPRTVSRSTPVSLFRRTPQRRKHESSILETVKETPTRATSRSSKGFDFGFNE